MLKMSYVSYLGQCLVVHYCMLNPNSQHVRCCFHHRRRWSPMLTMMIPMMLHAPPLQSICIDDDDDDFDVDVEDSSPEGVCGFLSVHPSAGDALSPGLVVGNERGVRHNKLSNRSRFDCTSRRFAVHHRVGRQGPEIMLEYVRGISGWCDVVPGIRWLFTRSGINEMIMKLARHLVSSARSVLQMLLVLEAFSINHLLMEY